MTVCIENDVHSRGFVLDDSVIPDTVYLLPPLHASNLHSPNCFYSTTSSRSWSLQNLGLPKLSHPLHNMATENLISDGSLRPLLQTSQATLAQTLAVLSWLEENASTPNPSLDLKLELAQQQKILSAYMAKLRGKHRQAAFGARATKQETAEARQEVDRLLLQLQNLYYEQRHLIGEIGACEGYEYVSVDSFASRRS